MMLFPRRSRAPREYTVRTGSPWTINDEPTTVTDPRAALDEIYETAELFPITITVIAPTRTLHLEMDEYGNTRAVDAPHAPDATSDATSDGLKDAENEVEAEAEVDDEVGDADHTEEEAAAASIAPSPAAPQAAPETDP